jgi:dolichol-phosphate mannosyltransferase
VHKNLVIIPTYNEKENIVAIVNAVMELPVEFHVLVIDDGSPDGTGQLVKDLQVENPDKLYLIERSRKLGLGTAYIKGFEYAIKNNYDFIYEMDADFSHNPQDLLKLYNSCAVDGYDMSIGSRYVGGVINVVNWPMTRVLMSYFASWYVRMVTGLNIMDTTAGFKCYSRKVIEAIEPAKINFIGYAFQIEMKFKALALGFKLKEVPVIFTERKYGKSKMDGKIIYEAVFGVLKLKLKETFGKIQ